MRADEASASRRQGSDADAELAAEPGLDVGRVALLAVGRLADELVEDLVDLGRERGLVVEAREGAEDLGQLRLLVAGEVEPDLGVGDAVVRGPGEDRRRARRAGEQHGPGGGRDGDQGDDDEGDDPLDGAPALLRRRGRDDGRCRDGVARGLGRQERRHGAGGGRRGRNRRGRCVRRGRVGRRRRGGDGRRARGHRRCGGHRLRRGLRGGGLRGRGRRRDPPPRAWTAARAVA